VIMDKQEIHTILNSLDIQVSMGRIDQPTYDTLKQKWQQQLLQAFGLSELTKQASGSSASA